MAERNRCRSPAGTGFYTRRLCRLPRHTQVMPRPSRTRRGLIPRVSPTTMRALLRRTLYAGSSPRRRRVIPRFLSSSAESSRECHSAPISSAGNVSQAVLFQRSDRTLPASDTTLTTSPPSISLGEERISKIFESEVIEAPVSPRRPRPDPSLVGP